MQVEEFGAKEVRLDGDYVGFDLIREELEDLTGFLDHISVLAEEGEERRLEKSLEAESGAMFIGDTGTGKTYATNCVANEAEDVGYQVLDGSPVLGDEVEREDVQDFFSEARDIAEENPVLMIYDDARELLGSKAADQMSQLFGGSSDETNPVLGEFRRQIDRSTDLDHPMYSIVTAVADFNNINDQMARRLSRHVKFSSPSMESREELFDYYIDLFGEDPQELDIPTFAHLTQGEAAGSIETHISKAYYRGQGEGFKNQEMVEEITRTLQGPPTDRAVTEDDKIDTGYHEFGGHVLPAYLAGLDPIMVSVKPSADGLNGKSIIRSSSRLKAGTTANAFANVVYSMGSTAVYAETERGKEEGRQNDLESAVQSAINLYALDNPIVKLNMQDGNYLAEGIASQELRSDLEDSVGEIRSEALDLSSEMVREHDEEIGDFVENHLVPNDIAVRNDIFAYLERSGIEHGSYREEVQERVQGLGYGLES